MVRASSGRGRARRVRATIPLIVAIAFLGSPGTAAAHSGAPTVALDFRVTLSAATRALNGVRVDLVDGDRGLRVRADSGTTLVVLGDLGEPFLRFSAGGVWVNRNSPTAAAVKLVPPSSGRGIAWMLHTAGHSVRWHDHRLAPPNGLRAGVARGWSVPILLSGRPSMIDGTYERVPRPRYWLWLGLALVIAFGVGGAAWRKPNARPTMLIVLGALAAAGALAASASFAIADEIGARSQWIDFGIVAALLLGILVAAWSGRRMLPVWIAVGMGIACGTLSLGSLGVVWHGYVISALPAPAARLAVLVAVTAGWATGFLGISVDSARVRGRPAPAPRPRGRQPLQAVPRGRRR